MFFFPARDVKRLEQPPPPAQEKDQHPRGVAVRSMGATASTQSLTKEQKAFVTQKLKSLYDENVGKHDPAALNTLLSEEYNTMAEAFLKANDELSRAKSGRGGSTSPRNHQKEKEDAPSVRGKVSLSANGSAKHTRSIDAKAGIGKSKSTRRRSFDLSSSKATKSPVASDAAAANAVSPELAMSKSESVMKALHEVTDSWDSVTHQPYCDVCKMAFRSPAFLERHVKFSSLHADNVKKSKEDAISALTSPPKPSKIDIVTQEEGTHFRLLYAGSKFFWRSQETIDFDIYHHFLAHAVEVIPFDTNKQKELPRIYLDYEPLSVAVDRAVDQEVDAQLEALKKDRFADIPDRETLKEDMAPKKFVTYILQRLRYESGVCDFFPSFSDEADHFPVMEKRPVVLVPVVITRRRRSSAEEIKDTISSIKSDRIAISASLEKANQFTSADKAKASQKMEYSNKIAHLVYNAACYLSAKPWYILKSPNMCRWHKAIDMVIRKNMVQKARDYLDKKGLNIPKTLPRKRSMIMSPTK